LWPPFVFIRSGTFRAMLGGAQGFYAFPPSPTRATGTGLRGHLDGLHHRTVLIDPGARSVALRSPHRLFGDGLRAHRRGPPVVAARPLSTSGNVAQEPDSDSPERRRYPSKLNNAASRHTTHIEV